jgi:hypothetical protein
MEQLVDKLSLIADQSLPRSANARERLCNYMETRGTTLRFIFILLAAVIHYVSLWIACLSLWLSLFFFGRCCGFRRCCHRRH